MSKHTPGPWNAGGVITDNISGAIATILENENGDPRANAALIAAAPEMLEALMRLENALGHMEHPDADILGRIAMDAIAKAEGKKEVV